jgi:hypothetical protein
MLGTDPDGGREPFGAAQGRLWGVKARRPLLSWRHKFRERPVCPRVSLDVFARNRAFPWPS